MWPKWPGFYTLAGSGASVSRAGVRTLARQVQRSSQPEAATVSAQLPGKSLLEGRHLRVHHTDQYTLMSCVGLKFSAGLCLPLQTDKHLNTYLTTSSCGALCLTLNL